MTKALEIGVSEFHFRRGEWNNGGEGRIRLAITSLGWIFSAGDLLAIELDAAGITHSVSFLSTLARVHPRGRRSDGTPDGGLALEPVASRFCIVIRRVFADLVDLRNDQSSDCKLGVFGQPHFHAA